MIDTTRTLRETSGRARLPDQSGRATSADGTRIAWDVYGSGDPTIVFLPSTPIVHSRQWKGQVPYLSRRYRVVTYDGRGNGLSDRPTTADAYQQQRIVGDLGAVLDATGTRAAVLVGLCGDAVWPAMQFAAAHPERVLGLVAFAVGVPLLSPPHPWRAGHDFDDELETYDGRGNGLSDRPTTADAYQQQRIVGDLEAVLDATATRAAVLVGLCGDGVWPAMQFAAVHPDRVLGIVAFAVGVPLLSPPHPWRA
ncbi:MAG: alpha/beta hydrolase, partial [Chloroflexota bacterium]